MTDVKTFEAMLARGQDGEMLRFTIGKLYWEQKQAEQAIPHLERAVELKPEYSSAWKILGRALVDAERLEEARNAFLCGLAAAVENGDKQTEKEINVFLKRVVKTLDSTPDS